MSNSIKQKWNTFFWLVRREFWEHKTIFWWLPLAVGVMLSTLFLVVEIQFKEVLNPEAYELQQRRFGAVKWAAMEMAHAQFVVSDLSRFFLHVLLFISAFMSMLYLLGALLDERKNRSILFWKSMPVSDTSEVLVKLVFPLLLSPSIALVVGFCSYFFPALLLAIGSFLFKDTLFLSIILNPDLYVVPLQFLSLLPFYALWALPTVAWFLMVSSWTRSRAFPWAVGLPVFVTIIVLYANSLFKWNWDMAWITKHLLLRLIGSPIPGSWVLEIHSEQFKGFNHNPGSGYLTPELMIDAAMNSLVGPSIWLGAVFGVVMLYLSIRSRRLNVATN